MYYSIVCYMCVIWIYLDVMKIGDGIVYILVYFYKTLKNFEKYREE